MAEVIVTAQKRSENLQKASISVDAVRPEELRNQGIHNAIDLQQIIPAVKFVAADEMTVSIRGLGTTNDNSGVDSAVAYNQDGIYLSHPEALTPVLFDIQRVEAVLGPQGTLYGRNSNAGVINFITNDPSFGFGGYVSAGYGNYNAWTTEGALNIPFGQTAALRIAAASENHGPYDKDGSNDLDAYAGRVKLLLKPTDDLAILLTADGARRRSAGATYGAICPPNTGVNGCNGVPYVPYDGLLPGAPGEYNKDDIAGASARIDYNLGWASLTSLTGYKAYWFHADVGPPWTNGVDNFDFKHDETDKFLTQEIRLASSPASAISWVGGVYYSHEQQLGGQSFFYHQGTLVQLGGGPPGFYQNFPITDSDYSSEAVFGDVTVPLGLTFRLRGGLRYTHESKEATGLVDSGIEGVTSFGSTVTHNKESESRLTWKAGADWDITPANLLYVTGSNGFKSGGVNNLPAEAASVSTYAPETITAVELGSKNRFFDGRLQINGSLFHYDYNNYQTYLFWNIPANAAAAPASLRGATLFPTVNSQKATFEGGEIEGIFRATSADTFSVGFNYLHDRFDKFVVALPYVPVVDFSNTEVFLAPRTTVSLGYSHEFTLANQDTVLFNVNSQLVASQIANGNYTDSNGVTRLYRVPAYHKTGINLSYHSGSMGLTATAFVRNLENAAVINNISGGFPVIPNFFYTNVMLDQPRTYGFSVRKDF